MSKFYFAALTISLFTFPAAAFAATPTGNFDGVQPDGVAFGWAFDPDTPTQSVQMRFYIGGPYGQGILIGNADANVFRPDVNSTMNISGNHGFSFRIPDTYAGSQHTLYAYTIDTSGTGENPMLPNSPKTFTFAKQNKSVIGNIDQIKSDATIVGWAFDPDEPSKSIDIHVYIDNPAGQGTIAAFGRATLERPDVNTAYNVTGPHGFSIPIPQSFADGKPHTVYVYGFDTTAGAVNPQLAQSPRTITIAPPAATVSGNATISANGITIKTTTRLAGAIDSLTWNGKEFVDSADHGRQIQTAWTGNNYGECFNPTEAGSLADGNGQYSTSQLLSLVSTSDSLTTVSHPAFWQNQNTWGENCYFDSNPAKQWLGGNSVNTTKNTRSTLQKTIQIGVPGLPNVIKYTSQITFDAQELQQTPLKYIVLGNPAVYTPTDFKKFYTVNTSGALVPQINATSPSQKIVFDPVILSTEDGKFAIGLYTLDVPRNGYPQNTPQYGYIGYGINNWGVAMGMETRAPQFPTNGNTFTPGTYTYTSYLSVGTLEDVRVALQKLSVPPPANTSAGPISALPTTSPFGGANGSTVTSSPAAELTASTEAALRAQLQTLLAQIAALQGQKTIPAASPSSGPVLCPNIVRNLSRGSRGSEVALLQRFLVSQRFLAADSATGFFGAMTEVAVKQWQVKNKVVSSGTPSTTGYGAVGPKTRAALASCSVN